MNIYFGDGEISLEVKLEGLSEEIKYDILHYLQNAVDREKGLQAKKLKNLESVYNEGYNELSNQTEGLHKPTSEYEEIAKAYKATANTEQKEVKQSQEKEDKPKYDGTWERNGETLYQLFYICNSLGCDGKGKRFVPKGSVFTRCHKCGKDNLKIRPAVRDDKFGEQDRYGNYYIAGSFLRENERSVPIRQPYEDSAL